MDIPRLVPPRTTKVELIPDVSALQDIDHHVKKTPKSSSSSVESLASYLSSVCRTDIHRVRSIFSWIAFNIKFDTSSCFSASTPHQDVASVLKYRKAVALGFSGLCQSLSTAMNIPCVSVRGFAKGFCYQLGTELTIDSKVDHAWNLVRVNDEWRPLDCVWGAGFLTKQKKFVQKLDEFWFLTDPSKFLPRHFPFSNGNYDDSALQLVSQPIGLSQFSCMLSPEPHAYTLGVEFISHSKNVIDVKNDVTITFRTPTPWESVLYDLIEGSNKRQISSSVLVSFPEENTCEIYVQPPKVSTYLLTIYGSDRGHAGDKYPCLVEYVIRCQQARENAEPFPEKSDPWGIMQPMASYCGILAKGAQFKYSANNGMVKVTIPFSEPAAVSVRMRHARARRDLSHFTNVTSTADQAIVCARLPRVGYYILTVYAALLNPMKRPMSWVGDLLLQANDDSDCGPFRESADSFCVCF